MLMSIFCQRQVQLVKLNKKLLAVWFSRAFAENLVWSYKIVCPALIWVPHTCALLIALQVPILLPEQSKAACNPTLLIWIAYASSASSMNEFHPALRMHLATRAIHTIVVDKPENFHCKSCIQLPTFSRTSRMHATETGFFSVLFETLFPYLFSEQRE